MIVHHLFKIYLFIVLIYSLLLTGCSKAEPDIQLVCKRLEIGNYLLKWEVTPQMEGELKIYISENPDSFNMAKPAITTSISKGVARYITKDNINRIYFKFSFNDCYFRTAGAKKVNLDFVHNCRDLGGYYTANKKHHTRWGRLFRSGELNQMSDWDSLRIESLKLKTILNLSSRTSALPQVNNNTNIISIPIPENDIQEQIKKIKEGHMLKGDAMLQLQDLYLQYIFKYNKQFSEALKICADKNNYPILFNCQVGKDQSGFLSILLLTILEIPEDVIIKDYTYSWNYMNKSQLVHLGKGLNYYGQETLTMLLSSKESLINFTLQQIKKQYGTVNKYITKALKITDKERECIKDAMLE